MNLSDISKESLEQLKKANRIKDPLLTIFGFERRVEFSQNIWAYKAGFHFKRENEDNLCGYLIFLYDMQGNVVADICPYDKNEIVKQLEKDYIVNSIRTNERYQEMVNDHRLFINDLNILFENIHSLELSEWSKSSSGNSYENVLKVKDITFEILIEVSKTDKKITIDDIQISQDDNNTFNKAFEIKSILIEHYPQLYTSWLKEISTI